MSSDRWWSSQWPSRSGRSGASSSPTARPAAASAAASDPSARHRSASARSARARCTSTPASAPVKQYPWPTLSSRGADGPSGARKARTLLMTPRRAPFQWRPGPSGHSTSASSSAVTGRPGRSAAKTRTVRGWTPARTVAVGPSPVRTTPSRWMSAGPSTPVTLPTSLTTGTQKRGRTRCGPGATARRWCAGSGGRDQPQCHLELVEHLLDGWPGHLGVGDPEVDDAVDPGPDLERQVCGVVGPGGGTSIQAGLDDVHQLAEGGLAGGVWGSPWPCSWTPPSSGPPWCRRS